VRQLPERGSPGHLLQGLARLTVAEFVTPKGVCTQGLADLFAKQLQASREQNKNMSGRDVESGDCAACALAGAESPH